MASKSALFFVLLFIATASIANAEIFVVSSVKVSGTLRCSGTPIPDIPVFLSLSGNQDFVASAVTTASGTFTIFSLSQAQFTLDTNIAFVYVDSPVANCPSFNQPNTKVYASFSADIMEDDVAQFTTGEFGYRN